MRSTLTCLAISACLTAVLSGCSSSLGHVSQLPQVPAKFTDGLSAHVTVTAPEAPAEVVIEGTSARTSTAAEGAGKGAFYMLRAASQADRLAPLVAALAPVGALAGAVAATLRHAEPEFVRAGESELRHRLTLVSRQGQLRDRVVGALRLPRGGGTASPDSPPAGMGPPSAWCVTVALDRIRLEPAGIGGQFRLVLTAHFQVRSADSDEPSYETPVEFRSNSELFVEWAADRGRMAQRTADYGLDQIARQIARALTST